MYYILGVLHPWWTSPSTLRCSSLRDSPFNPFRSTDRNHPHKESSFWSSDHSRIPVSPTTTTVTSRTLHPPWCLALVDSRFSGCSISSLCLTSPHLELPIGADGHIEMQPRHHFHYAGHPSHYVASRPQSRAAHRLESVTPHATKNTKRWRVCSLEYTAVLTVAILFHSFNLCEPLLKISSLSYRRSLTPTA